jgi:hypothetical protein
MSLAAVQFFLAKAIPAKVSRSLLVAIFKMWILLVLSTVLPAADVLGLPEPPMYTWPAVAAAVAVPYIFPSFAPGSAVIAAAAFILYAPMQEMLDTAALHTGTWIMILFVAALGPLLLWPILRM